MHCSHIHSLPVMHEVNNVVSALYIGVFLLILSSSISELFDISYPSLHSHTSTYTCYFTLHSSLTHSSLSLSHLSPILHALQLQIVSAEHSFEVTILSGYGHHQMCSRGRLLSWQKRDFSFMHRTSFGWVHSNSVSNAPTQTHTSTHTPTVYTYAYKFTQDIYFVNALV